MGSQLSKGGVAAEGKAAAADPTAAKANGQVSELGPLMRGGHQGGATWHQRPPPAWVPRRNPLLLPPQISLH